jgi:hypothetical protein
MRIELLYFDGCPGHAELRDRLPLLLEQAGVDARIEGLQRTPPEAWVTEALRGARPAPDASGGTP